MPKLVRNISVADSIKEALVLSMKKNKNVLLIGLGVDDPKGIFGTTKGIDKMFKEKNIKISVYYNSWRSYDKASILVFD